jgi:hypothetical protein
MTKSLRWCCMAWMLLLAPLAARADGPTWTVVPPVAYPEPTKDAHDQSIDTYRMTVLANGGTFDADRYWLRFDGRTPLLACATPQPPSKGPLDLTQCVVRLELTNGKTQAVFSQLPADLGGAQKFVIVPDQTSKPAPAPATTAPPTATSAPQPGTAPPGTPPGGTSTTPPAGTPTTTPVGTSTTAPVGASGGTPAPAAGTVIAPACTSAPPGCEFEVAFALVTPGAVRAYALLVVAALLGIVLLLLNSGQKRTLSTGKGVGLLQAAFLDVETRTYSLSKLQFYIWGFAVISGYIYLTMARSLVQGAFEFASIPDNLPLLMGLSVGTSVASVGVSSLAGNKGAGDVGPLPSDLITSGGVVAPERLLHLLWTIIGGTAFLGFAFSVAPETINNLPSVPNGFLELMGVSAAGYVGGKVARGPGPNVQSITIDPPNGGAAGTAVDPLPIQIDGTNLATEGATYLMAQVRPSLNNPDTTVQLATPFRAGSIVDSQKMATRINTSIAAAAPNLIFKVGNRYSFTIVNPDGEKAVWEFDVT